MQLIPPHPSILLLALATFLPFSTLAHHYYILPRKITDPYIHCFGIPPQLGPRLFHAITNPNPIGYPLGYAASQYPTLISLCSVANGIHNRNLGCLCASALSRLHCSEALADEKLWSTRESTERTFGEFCEVFCKCGVPEVAAALRDVQMTTEAAGADEDPVYMDDEEGTREATLGDDDEFEETGTSSSSAYDDAMAGSSNETSKSITLSGNSVVVESKCGGNCTTNKECVGTGECRCVARSLTYVPGQGALKFVAACLVSVVGGHGKRGDEGPCACNASYVSYVCCEVGDSLVWEDRRFKLGEIGGAL